MSWGFTVCLPWRNLQKSASRRWKYLDSRKSWIIRLGWIQKMVMVAQVPLFCGVGEYTLPFRPILSDRTKDTKTTFCGLNKIFLTSKNHISPPSSQPPQLLLWMTERLFGLPALSSQKNHTQWWGHHCQGEKFCEGVRCRSSQSDDCWCSLLGTNISPPKGTFEDAFSFPKLGDMLVPCTVTTMGFDDDTHVKIKHPILKISSRVHYIALGVNNAGRSWKDIWSLPREAWKCYHFWSSFVARRSIQLHFVVNQCQTFFSCISRFHFLWPSKYLQKKTTET